MDLQVFDSIKTTTGYGIAAWLWVIFLSVLGNVVSYIQKLKRGIIDRVSLIEFTAECAIAIFAGMVTFFLCDAAGMKPALTSALVAVAGHMGGRLIFQIEELGSKIITRWVCKLLGIDAPADPVSVPEVKP
jgi:hypothetical protein